MPTPSSTMTCIVLQILHVLGTEGPKTKDPSKYIRYIYNRIILENATVRAAAVSALASFGAAQVRRENHQPFSLPASLSPSLLPAPLDELLCSSLSYSPTH